MTVHNMVIASMCMYMPRNLIEAFLGHHEILKLPSIRFSCITLSIDLILQILSSLSAWPCKDHPLHYQWDYSPLALLCVPDPQLPYCCVDLRCSVPWLEHLVSP